MPKVSEDNADESFDFRIELEAERFHQRSAKRITSNLVKLIFK
jgi:hypothetical protein